MPMRFDHRSIDLNATHSNYRQRYRHPKIETTGFGLPVVRLANWTLGGYGPSPGDLGGIRTCLLQKTLHLSWGSRLRRLLLFTDERPFDGGIWGPSGRDRDDASLIVDSLILTVSNCRQGLREFHSNLAPILFAEILAGFELLVGWHMRGVPLDPNGNDLIATLPVQEVLARLGWSSCTVSHDPSILKSFLQNVAAWPDDQRKLALGAVREVLAGDPPDVEKLRPGLTSDQFRATSEVLSAIDRSSRAGKQ
jgi:hypothetical protein